MSNLNNNLQASSGVSGGAGRSSRAERLPVSCGECRRRKQKVSSSSYFLILGRALFIDSSNCPSAIKANHAVTAPGGFRRHCASTWRTILGAAFLHLYFLPRKHMTDISDRSSRRSGARVPSPVSPLAFSALPLVFTGDDHVPIEGISQALLPTNSEHSQFQLQHWQRPTQVFQPPDWWDHWMETPTCGANNNRNSPELLALCPQDCTLHSSAYHTAEVLLSKINAFPTRYFGRWQPEKTDEVLFWLCQQQTPFSPGLPSTATSTSVSMSPQPTRQDAELLRICK